MNNPFQLFQAMRNPQQFLQQMAGNSQAMSNPILKNAMDMANKGDTKGVEQLARNLCKEKGINVDDAVRQIKTIWNAIKRDTNSCARLCI